MSATGASKHISVLTFNILGTPFLTTHQVKNYLYMNRFLFKRMQKIGELLNDSDVDIITLQEVYSYPVLFMLKAKLKKYPYVAYKPFIYGPRGGLVIFSKHPFVNKTYIDFFTHGSLFNKSIMAKITQNGMLVCKLRDLPLSIMTTYLTANTDHNWESPVNRFSTLKQLQIQHLAYIVNTLAFSKDELIITGDFNMSKHSHDYELLKELTEVRDTFSHSFTPTQHKDFLPQDINAPILDYIFVTQNHGDVEVAESKQVFNHKISLTKNHSSYLSDHIGLKTDLHFYFHQHYHDTLHKTQHSFETVMGKTIN